MNTFLRSLLLKATLLAVLGIGIVVAGNIMHESKPTGILGDVSAVVDQVSPMGPVGEASAAGNKNLPNCGYNQGCWVNFGSWGSHWVIFTVAYKVITNPSVTRYTTLDVYCNGPTVCYGQVQMWPTYGIKYVNISTNDPPTTFANYGAY